MILAFSEAFQQHKVALENSYKDLGKATSRKHDKNEPCVNHRSHNSIEKRNGLLRAGCRGMCCC